MVVFFLHNTGGNPFQNLVYFLVEDTEKILDVFQKPVSGSQDFRNHIFQQYFYKAFLNFC